MSTTTETQFEPILLEVNHENVQRQMATFVKNIYHFNWVLSEASNFIERELTVDEALQVLLKPKSTILELIKEQYKFPNANDEFNLQAIGKDIKKLDGDLGKVSFDPQYHIVDTDSVTLIDNLEQILIEKSSVYTTNQAQNAMLKKAKDLCKQFNNLEMLSMYDIGHIERIFKLVVSKAHVYFPNNNYILQIDENGTYTGI